MVSMNKSQKNLRLLTVISHVYGYGTEYVGKLQSISTSHGAPATLRGEATTRPRAMKEG
jgi:hypothetical protein